MGSESHVLERSGRVLATLFIKVWPCHRSEASQAFGMLRAEGCSVPFHPYRGVPLGGAP